MNLSNKNIAAFIFVAILSFPIFFSTFTYFKIKSIQHKMRNLLEIESLQSVSIPITDFRWYKYEKEIVVNGKMFDVKSIKKVDLNYIVTGLFDTDQTNLQKTAVRFSLEKRNKQQSASTYSAAFISLYPFPQQKEIASFYYRKQLNYCLIGNKKIQNIHIDILTPPPQKFA